jgi:hypothetical protein
MKLLAIHLYAAILIALVVMFEGWLVTHKFASAVLALIAVIGIFVIGVVWRFNVPCPRCGWNINLKKDPPGWPAITIPASCPNCAEDLYRSPAAS